MCRLVVLYAVTFLFLLQGCGGPSDEAVTADFEALLEKEVGRDVIPVISSITPGEGDGGNVYLHIAFDVVARRDVVFDAGWLRGIAIAKGIRLYGGEVVILYQKGPEDGRWRPAGHSLTRRPSLPR